MSIYGLLGKSFLRMWYLNQGLKEVREPHVAEEEQLQIPSGGVHLACGRSQASGVEGECGGGGVEGEVRGWPDRTEPCRPLERLGCFTLRTELLERLGLRSHVV